MLETFDCFFYPYDYSKNPSPSRFHVLQSMKRSFIWPLFQPFFNDFFPSLFLNHHFAYVTLQLFATTEHVIDQGKFDEISTFIHLHVSIKRS